MKVAGLVVNPRVIVSFNAKSKGQTSKKQKNSSSSQAKSGVKSPYLANVTSKKVPYVFESFLQNQTQASKPIVLRERVSDTDKLKMTHANITLGKYSGVFHGVQLLKQNNILNRNEEKYTSAIQTIRNIGFEKLTSKESLAQLEKKNPVLWSVTSEFAPVKEGGLGAVPPDIRDNAQKLGIGVVTFVPMYLNEGHATLCKKDNNYTYTYKNKELPLEKLMTFKMDVYKNGASKSIPINLFLNTQKDENGKEKHLIFIQTDNYFDGTIYEANSKTEEPEKFAIFSKAVYEFMKMKMDGTKALKDVEIHSSQALEKIQKPDGMILNDWHASPLAALLRYRAVMENAYGQLSDETTQSLKDMRVVTIGHNVIYQGSTQNNNAFLQKKMATQNVLNTLFDEYTFDIVSNAKSGATKIDKKNPQMQIYDNVLLMDYQNERENYTNLLNMGIILSDYFAPVSKNYTKELLKPELNNLSYALQWALVQKGKAGKLVGVLNGNNYENLSIKTKLPQIKETTGLDFEVYKKSDSIEEISQKRLKNKANLYSNFILPYSESSKSKKEDIEKVKKLTSKLEFYKGTQGTSLPIIKQKEFENTPVLISGGRLVSQKGSEILCGAIEMLFKNWEKDFPNKNKPIFYIAGADGEGGTQRKIIENLKNEKLTKEDNNRVLFAHGYAPMSALMAGSDFFLMPSKFEPCGLTQSESLALGTPVIASAVGGLVDTINRDNKTNGILTDDSKPLTAESFYEAMKKGLKIYFEDKNAYQKMVQDSINEDFSWIKEDKKGPMYEYLELLGIKA